MHQIHIFITIEIHFLVYVWIDDIRKVYGASRKNNELIHISLIEAEDENIGLNRVLNNCNLKEIANRAHKKGNILITDSSVYHSIA
jgi:hypothetical protein